MAKDETANRKIPSNVNNLENTFHVDLPTDTYRHFRVFSEANKAKQKNFNANKTANERIILIF